MADEWIEVPPKEEDEWVEVDETPFPGEPGSEVPTPTPTPVPTAAAAEPVDPTQFKANPVEAFALSATNLFGLGDEAVGAGTAAYQTGRDVLKGDVANAVSRLGSRYRRARDEAREAFGEVRRQNPKASIAGDITQAVGIGALTAGLGAGAGAAQGANAANTARTGVLATKVVPAMVQGGLYGFGNSNADLTKGEVGRAALDTGVGAGVGGALSLVPARATIGGLAGGWLARKDIERGDYGRAAAKIGAGAGAGYLGGKLWDNRARIFGNVMGVNDDAIRDYLANSKAINANPTKAEIKDKIDLKVTALRDAAESAEEQAVQAKGMRAVEVGDDIDRSLEQLRGDVVKGSRNATTLIPDDVTIPTKVLKTQLTKQLRTLTPIGKEAGPAPGAQSDSFNRLMQWRDYLDKLPAEIDGKQAKSLMKAIDRATSEAYSRPAGTFAPEEQTALARLRQYMDMKVKSQAPAYRDAMQGVRDDMRLLNAGTDVLGKSGARTGRLQNLGSYTANDTKGVLENLSGRTGNDFLGSLDELALPEAQAAAAARARAAPFDKLSPSNSETFLNRLTPKYEAKDLQPPIEAQKMQTALEAELPGITGEIKNLKTLRAFEGERTNGTRNAFRFGAAGGAIGGMVGGPTGAMSGTAAGGAVGAYVDKHGPRMAKEMLDKYIPLRDGATKVVSTIASDPRVARHVPQIVAAGKNGAGRQAATVFTLQQTSPAFRQAVEEARKRQEEERASR